MRDKTLPPGRKAGTRGQRGLGRGRQAWVYSESKQFHREVGRECENQGAACPLPSPRPPGRAGPQAPLVWSEKGPQDLAIWTRLPHRDQPVPAAPAGSLRLPWHLSQAQKGSVLPRAFWAGGWKAGATGGQLTAERLREHQLEGAKMHVIFNLEP